MATKMQQAKKDWKKMSFMDRQDALDNPEIMDLYPEKKEDRKILDWLDRHQLHYPKKHKLKKVSY